MRKFLVLFRNTELLAESEVESQNEVLGTVLSNRNTVQESRT